MNLTNGIWMRIIIHIEDMTITQITRKLEHTGSMVSKVCREMERLGWLTSKTVGRHKEHKLTEKGQKIKNACLLILSETNGLKVKR